MRRVVLAVAALVLIQCQAGAITVDTNWWSNRTADQNVIDPLFGSPPITERVRLGNFLTGHIEGTVALPTDGLWEVYIPVRADSDSRRDPNETVDVYINSGLVGTAHNTPASSTTTFTPWVAGNSFTYRFEFASSNATDHLHQIVGRGTATAVPEPVTLVSFGFAVVAVGGSVLRRRATSR